MLDDQQRLGSGFGAHTTATEVLTGVNLVDKTALVTGGYSGIGIEVARALHAAGAHVLVPARRPDLATKELDGLGGLWLEDCDVGPWAAGDGLNAIGVKRYAEDPAEAERLWAWSVEQTGVNLRT